MRPVVLIGDRGDGVLEVPYIQGRSWPAQPVSAARTIKQRCFGLELPSRESRARRRLVWARTREFILPFAGRDVPWHCFCSIMLVKGMGESGYLLHGHCHWIFALCPL